MILKWLLPACFAVALVFPAAAQTVMGTDEAQNTFIRANEAYRRQDYKTAHATYAKVAAAGYRSPELFFNLGNASARLGRVGESVLNYERARELDPRDPDIAANLKRMAPPGNDPQPFVLTVPFHWLLGVLSLREWMGLFLGLHVAACLLGGCVFLLRPGIARTWLRRIALTAACAAALTAVFAAVRLYQYQGVQYSVVMAAKAEVRSGPGTGFSMLTAVPEGTKVRRLEFGGDANWARVMLMDGQAGFVRLGELAPI